MKRLKELLMDKNRKTLQSLFIVLVAAVVLLLLAQGFLGSSENVPVADDGHGYFGRADPPVCEGGGRPDIEVRLEEILSLVDGAGEVRVLLHFATGPQTVFARDTTLDESALSETDGVGGNREQSQQRLQSNVVTLSRREGGDEPLVLYENSAQIEGVIIVAGGGGNIFVRDALTRAANALLGVPIHKISVLPKAP